MGEKVGEKVYLLSSKGMSVWLETVEAKYHIYNAELTGRSVGSSDGVSVGEFVCSPRKWIKCKQLLGRVLVV